MPRGFFISRVKGWALEDTAPGDLDVGRAENDAEQHRQKEQDHRHGQLGGSAAAFFSATFMRISRLSLARTRKACATGVP